MGERDGRLKSSFCRRAVRLWQPATDWKSKGKSIPAAEESADTQSPSWIVARRGANSLNAVYTRSYLCGNE